MFGACWALSISIAILRRMSSERSQDEVQHCFFPERWLACGKPNLFGTKTPSCFAEMLEWNSNSRTLKYSVLDQVCFPTFTKVCFSETFGSKWSKNFCRSFCWLNYLQQKALMKYFSWALFFTASSSGLLLHEVFLPSILACYRKLS